MRKYQLIGAPAPHRPCANFNHRRPHAALRHCSACGEVVNPAVRAQRCSKAQHMAARRRQTTFCLACGTRLVGGESAAPRRTARRRIVVRAAVDARDGRVKDAAGAPTADGKLRR